MELYDAIRNAPTTRRFTDEPVARETLVRVLDAARFAPSGGNRQGWRVVAVEDADTRRALRDLYLPPWRAYLERQGALAVLDDPDSFPPEVARRVQGANASAERMHEAPLHLVVLVDLSTLAIADRDLNRPSVIGGASIYPFVQNVLLGLRDENLGAALTTLIAPAEDEVRKLLQIPDGLAVAALILVGHRDGDWPRRLSRNPVEEFAFLDRYGAPLG